MESDDFDTLEAPVLMSSGDDSVVNTVNLTSVQMCLSYYDMAGVIRYKEVWLDKNGYASMSLPSDYASPIWFGFVLHKGALPPAGKYKMSVHFGSNTNIVYQSSSIWFGVRRNNVSQQESNYYVDGYYSSGDFRLSTDLSIGASTSQLNISNFLAYDSPAPPYGGYVSINFTRLSGDAPVQGGSPDSGNVDQDINQSISNNTAQQVEQGDTIIELIKNTIQTISSQLTAFWNQLAGEFTNLYNKMTQQHSEQLQADRDNTDDMIAAGQSNTTDIINNNNVNTDKVTGGYDNSGMLSENDRLNSSLDGYQEQEDEVFNQAKDKVDSFEYGNHFDRFTAPLADISFFLTGIYDGLGSLNVPIAFALTLSISLLAVGYYRFKSGS
ncbi:hypothetical protein [Enterocloster hominis (ex Hitch et al. 2024)]|uniref:Uncharacterized protein n=1 Tax=Enterocloster hominis (ex Hitch et al. 2024) TaxID=1917870 RepID=A0ABV1DEV7_9FIRM